MKKKLLACFLCAVMAVTMAVPAFAADDAAVFRRLGLIMEWQINTETLLIVD